MWKPCCKSTNHILEYGPATHRVIIHADPPVEHLERVAGIIWLLGNDMIVDLCETCQRLVEENDRLTITHAPTVW